MANSAKSTNLTYSLLELSLSGNMPMKEMRARKILWNTTDDGVKKMKKNYHLKEK